MTGEEELRRMEARRRTFTADVEEGLKLNEHNLNLIEEWLSNLERTRASIGEQEYSRQKTIALQWRQKNYELRQQYYDLRRTAYEAKRRR